VDEGSLALAAGFEGEEALHHLLVGAEDGKADEEGVEGGAPEGLGVAEVPAQVQEIEASGVVGEAPGVGQAAGEAPEEVADDGEPGDEEDGGFEGAGPDDGLDAAEGDEGGADDGEEDEGGFGGEVEDDGDRLAGDEEADAGGEESGDEEEGGAGDLGFGAEAVAEELVDCRTLVFIERRYE